MTQGKSIRIVAGAALLGVLGYALLVRCKRDPEPQPGGGAASRGGGDAGAVAGPELEIAIARETGAAWYCEGDAIQGAWDKAHAALKRVAESPYATPQDFVNLACVKLKLFADDTTKQATETPAIKELCQRALARDPKLATAHFVLGAIAWDRESDAAAAKAAFEQAVACAPDDVAAKLRLADMLNEGGDRDQAIAVYRSVRERGPEFAGSFFMTATFRLARLIRQRKQGDDLKNSAELLAEHKRLSDAGATNPSEEDIKLGTLARVKLPSPQGAAGVAPSAPPPVKFAAQPPLLAEELAQTFCFDVADLDNDQRPDLVAAGASKDGKAALWALLQDEKGAFRKQLIREGVFFRLLPVDLENEFGMSLLLGGQDGGLTLLAPAPDGSGGWVDASTQLPPLPKSMHDLLGVDFGHDGMLDLAFATGEGIRLVRNDGVPRDEFTKERSGAVHLKDVSAEAGMPTGSFDWIAMEDFDGDQDIDLLAGGTETPTLLLSNLRKGRFEIVPPEKSGLPKVIAQRPLLADLDHDGRPDVLVPGAPPGLASNRGSSGGRVTFAPLQPLPDLAPLWSAGATLADVDLNGELDFVGSGADGGITVRFGALTAAKGATLALGGAPATSLAPPRLADLDDDGDLDLVTLDEKGAPGLFVRCGSVGGGPGSLLLEMRGIKDNRQAIGAIVEVRAQQLYQRRLATERQQLFGLGAQKSADIVRITWPNGVVQCLVSPASSSDLKARPCGGALDAGTAGAPARPVTRVAVAQKEGLAGSCPFLYAWNGKSYGFATDVLGITPLGLPMTESMYVPPDHDELVRLTSDQLAPVDGEYRMQFTEELREVTYLDRAQLWVVDHAADVEVHPEERFTFPPFPPQHLHTVKGALPLVKAVDQKGRDWTGALAREDHVHAVPFEPHDSRYLGLVTGHWLELTLPEAAKTAKKVRLLMTGWLYWTDASVNVLAARNGSLEFVPPLISVPDGNGGWKEAGPPVGFPAGKTKTMVLDVTSMVNRADPRLRIFSTIRLYWDQIRVAVDDDDAPLAVTKLEPKLAKLWYRGFSAPVFGASGDQSGEQPARFDWDHLESTARWNQHPGLLTRYGDVLPLLGAIDDRFTILSSGDAIDLRFDASASAPIAPGRARTFVLFLDGWAKDADPNTTYSQSVEPLPFHAMSGYPYGPDEHYPDDSTHDDYRIDWNTRPGRRLIPDLATPRPLEARALR